MIVEKRWIVQSFAIKLIKFVKFVKPEQGQRCYWLGTLTSPLPQQTDFLSDDLGNLIKKKLLNSELKTIYVHFEAAVVPYGYDWRHIIVIVVPLRNVQRTVSPLLLHSREKLCRTKTMQNTGFYKISLYCFLRYDQFCHLSSK